MLTSLSIKNYALIDHLDVDFDKGLTIITGETGAGKSILLGGLSLILGKRADLSSLKQKDEKCIIEAEFFIGKYQLQSFFSGHDIDYEEYTIIRREILPSGKSRAFINDSPSNLDTLSKLGLRLIDIHSQHQTLQLMENDFQFNIIDAVAENNQLLKEYQNTLKTYTKTKKELQELLNTQSEANKEQDYKTFLLKELQETELSDGIQEELEAQYEELSNVESIIEKLTLSNQLLTEDQLGALTVINQLKNEFSKLSVYGQKFKELSERIQSVYIELDDIRTEVEAMETTIDANPELLEETNNKLQQLYHLQKKHNVNSVEALIELRSELEVHVKKTENLDTEIEKLQISLLKQEKELDNISEIIHTNREKAIPGLIQKLETSLSHLGMNNARFNIQLQTVETYFQNGKDELQLLFSTNKGSSFGTLKKVASGGELSRIMLSIKSILSEYIQLPTIMFDEIDTGVSGEVSNKMAAIMEKMSKHMQVFTITHLPQIAAKGDAHFKVFKTDINNITTTGMRKLDEASRINEIAEMLGGKEISNSAVAHARELLN